MFRLALAMHEPNVDKIRRLPAKLIAQWVWYEEVEPFGELRADWRAAQIVAMVHNVAVKSEHQKGLDKFLLKFGDAPMKPTRQTPMEQVAIIKILAHALAAAKE